MASYVLKDSKLYLAGFDLSGFMSNLALTYEAEALDETTFGKATRIHKAGLMNVGLNHRGFFDAGSAGLPDDLSFSKLGVTNEVMTVAPETGAAGEIGFVTRVLEASYVPGGSVGEMLAFTINAHGVDELVRATIMENSNKTATGSGTARNLGSVSATQKLYAAMHVIAAGPAGPLDMRIQSDDASGFLSPTTRVTFTQQTGISSQWATPIAGPITDTWWRADWTIGVSLNFTVVVLVGIK